MESSNLHQHQLHQDHQLLVGSSTLATPCLSVGNNHALTSDLVLNSSNIYASSAQVLFGDLIQKNHFNVPNSLGNLSLQDLSCHSWLDNTRGNAANGCFVSPSPEHDDRQYLAKIKEELNSVNSSSFSKFTDLLNSSNLSRIQKNDEEQRQMSDLSEKLLLKTLLLSPNHQFGSTLHLPRGAFQSLSTANDMPFTVGPMLSIQGNASQAHPTALDLFSMERPSVESVKHPTDDDNPGLVEDSSQLGFTRMQQCSRKKQLVDPENISSFDNNGVSTEPKRPCNVVEPKATQSVSKRPRAESRSSCPPFKVRKEKLGDRIAALQQLVAPFGKTDTASVLMEAIGYINFLQNQVETLSVPYMNLSSRRKGSTAMQEVSCGNAENKETKPDLRSRGLCLVPLSCMSYITNDGGGGVWPPHPPNFNPGF